MPGILTVFLVVGLIQGAPTLGRELLGRSLPVPKDAADLEQPITSYSVLDDERAFVIAYYGVEPDGMLHALRIRSYDKADRLWRTMTRPEPIGSVVSLKRNGAFLYVTGHSSPSAAPLLVVTAHLQLKRELNGWPVLMLDGGGIVFKRSMVHFAPTHAESLAVYDPVADHETALYPPPAAQNHRGAERVSGTDLWVERSFEDLRTGAAPGTIEFTAVEQRMRLDSRQAAQPERAERRLKMACHVSAPVPTCRERK